MKAVCIVGIPPEPAYLLRQEAQDTEIWGLNQGHAIFPADILARCTRWFQIHPWEPMSERQDPRLGHIEWLAEASEHMTVYFEEPVPDIPKAVRYPYEEVKATIGSAYFASNSFCYMTALAIHEGFDEIHLYGVDFGPNDIGDGYARGPMEFLLGFAVARGIKVWVPSHSHLLKCDMYARSVDASVLALENAMDVLDSYSQRMMHSAAKARVMRGNAALAELFAEAMGNRARHEPWRAVRV